MKSTLSKGLYVSLLFSLALVSCKENKGEPAVEEPAATSAPAETQAPQAITPEPATATPAAPAASGDVAVNPPHGQPGHRCEIPVGAPLNSQPNTNPAPPQPMSQPAPTPPVAVPAPMAATAPGMNPPHGQPGHRCDVAVGAPLPK